MSKRDETIEMAILYEEQGLTIRQIGELYGISKQTISQRFKGINVVIRRTPRPRPPKHLQIDTEQLKDLYTKQRLPVKSIARILQTYPQAVRMALEFHKIPRRPLVRAAGKHLSLLRKLQTGDQEEIKCGGKYPHNSLYSSARRARIKISVKKIENQVFRVIRIV